MPPARGNDVAGVQEIELPPEIDGGSGPAGKKKIKLKSNVLGELSATAICGNDITSSCLYVSALTIIYAGKWAPVSLLIVAAVLYLYRGIYAEVVGALPLNGGAYNALLNTTSKSRASIAACLTILSYMATAVISASTAMYYVQTLWSGLPVMYATVGLLAVFMVLTIFGITESAAVAVGIFIIHICTLILLIVVGGGYLLTNGLDILIANLQTPAPGGLGTALLFGFAAAMLGVSGFESSANFVEEQADGVFPKTLRNMWVAVAFFNPAIALLALALVPIVQVEPNKLVLLAHMGKISGGQWLAWLISIDAALVLSGAVLTSYVGVNGLILRMTLDRCLPQFLLKSNRRGSFHRIIIGFFFLAVSVLLITKGELKALAGVYTLSFLSVMALFGLGNILLKVKRERLPRPSRAGWTTVIAGIAAVLIALVGNAVMNPPYLRVFFNYFIPSMMIIAIMLTRITLLKGCLFLVRIASATMYHFLGGVTDTIREKIDAINSQQVVFFTRGDNVSNLNSAILYVRDNENTNRIKIVTVVKEKKEVPDKLKNDLKYLAETYPHIDIDFVIVEAEFGPDLIQDLSEKWNIPANLMFIGSPGGRLVYSQAELGGVRLVI